MLSFQEFKRIAHSISSTGTGSWVAIDLRSNGVAREGNSAVMKYRLSKCTRKV